MIKDIILKEINSFIESEEKRVKEQKSLHEDPKLKAVGITKDYVAVVEQLLEEKKLEAAKKLLAELDGIITKIKDEEIKQKVYSIRTEVRNAIELNEKIASNKKELELRLKSIKSAEKKSFISDTKSQDPNISRLRSMMSQGIGAKQKPTAPTFFTSAPTKLTVVQNIITPEHPLPSEKKVGGTKPSTQEEARQPAAPTEQVITENFVQPAIAMPQIPPVIIQQKPDESEKFARVGFLISELDSLLEEKDLNEARKEYDRARDLLEGLQDTEEKHELSNKLFSAYHKIKTLEKGNDEQALKKLGEDANKEKQAKELAEEETRRKELEQQHEEEIIKQNQILEEQKSLAEKELKEEELLEKLKNSKPTQEIPEALQPTEKESTIPPVKRAEETEKQQEILEKKHDQVKKGESLEQLEEEQEALNSMRALKELPTPKDMPITNFGDRNIAEVEQDLMDELKSKQIEKEVEKELEEVFSPAKKIEIPKINQEIQSSLFGFETKETGKTYNKAVSMLYKGNKSEAKKLFEEVVKANPNNMAAKIRLMECNT